jgi:hypothetical protein
MILPSEIRVRVVGERFELLNDESGFVEKDDSGLESV